jgi:hypothetical protein
MPGIPTEPTDGQFKDMGSMFNQPSPASSKPAGDDDSKAPLPKGVVLDKDGKPYVSTNRQSITIDPSHTKLTHRPQLPHLHLRCLMASIEKASRPQEHKPSIKQLTVYLDPK